jgi:hypothetical protein
MLSGMKITEVSKYFRERKYGPSGSVCNFLSFPLVGNLPEPLFGKEGQEEILWRIDLFKKTPQSPFAKGGQEVDYLLKGEDTRKILDASLPMRVAPS